mmetsp:Transcript_126722/g.253298  ORF Transcript_126722/g.253298 Transcript_126722/m.253298 type:complete len:261 (-) Transcript_126722:334-1116(-)
MMLQAATSDARSHSDTLCEVYATDAKPHPDWVREASWLLRVSDFLLVRDLVQAWQSTSRDWKLGLFLHRPDMAALLLKGRAAMSAAQGMADSHSPVLAAVQLEESVLVLRELARLGCSMSDTDDEGRTAAHHAAEWGDFATLRVLGDLGCQLGVADHEGRTAMHVAVEVGDVQVLRTLQELGCAVDAVDGGGRTAAHLAAEFGDINSLKALHELGCPMTIQDASGRTPAHLAADVEDDEVANFLRDLIDGSCRGGCKCSS